MITSSDAESLAQQMMQDYVNKCGCASHEDVANVLMKLVSMCGLGMCAVVGQGEAVKRLEQTAAYISTTQEGRNWRAERAH